MLLIPCSFFLSLVHKKSSGRRWSDRFTSRRSSTTRRDFGELRTLHTTAVVNCDKLGVNAGLRLALRLFWDAVASANMQFMGWHWRDQKYRECLQRQGSVSCIWFLSTSKPGACWCGDHRITVFWQHAEDAEGQWHWWWQCQEGGPIFEYLVSGAQTARCTCIPGSGKAAPTPDCWRPHSHGDSGSASRPS